MATDELSEVLERMDQIEKRVFFVALGLTSPAMHDDAVTQLESLVSEWQALADRGRNG